MHEAFRRIGGVEDDDALGVVGGPELESFPDAGVERHLLGFETPLFAEKAHMTDAMHRKPHDVAAGIQK